MYRVDMVEPVLADPVLAGEPGPGGGPGPGAAFDVGDAALPAPGPQPQPRVVQRHGGAPGTKAVQVEHLLLSQVLLDLLLLVVLQPVQGHPHELGHVILTN